MVAVLLFIMGTSLAVETVGRKNQAAGVQAPL